MFSVNMVHEPNITFIMNIMMLKIVNDNTVLLGGRIILWISCKLIQYL